MPALALVTPAVTRGRCPPPRAAAGRGRRALPADISRMRRMSSGNRTRRGTRKRAIVLGGTGASLRTLTPCGRTRYRCVDAGLESRVGKSSGCDLRSHPRPATPVSCSRETPSGLHALTAPGKRGSGRIGRGVVRIVEYAKRAAGAEHGLSEAQDVRELARDQDEVAAEAEVKVGHRVPPASPWLVPGRRGRASCRARRCRRSGGRSP